MMARQFLYGILLISLLSISNNSRAQTSAGKSNKIINSVTATVSGDESKNIKASGEEDVALGFFKFTKAGISPITIGGTLMAKDGTSYKVTFVMPVSFQTGIEQQGSFGSFSVENDTQTRNYTTTFYQNFFDTDENGANSKVYLTLSEVVELKDYLKISGQFHFNAAYDANPDSPAGMNTGGGLPPFIGAVRGSKKVNVNGTFTVYLTKLMMD